MYSIQVMRMTVLFPTCCPFKAILMMRMVESDNRVSGCKAGTSPPTFIESLSMPLIASDGGRLQTLMGQPESGRYSAQPRWRHPRSWTTSFPCTLPCLRSCERPPQSPVIRLRISWASSPLIFKQPFNFYAWFYSQTKKIQGRTANVTWQDKS